MKEIFHLYSFGEKTPDLLTGDADFKWVLNLVAVLSYIEQISVLAFGFEDTHIHLLVEGVQENCVKFKKQLQRLVRRYDSMAFELEMEKVASQGYLLKVGAYVICQATKDGKRVLPVDYLWSSAALYFRTVQNDLLWKTDSEGNKLQVMKMSEISRRDQRRLFHTKAKLPPGWEVCNGWIIPSSFVDVKRFEMIYRTHNAFRTFCGGSRSSDEVIFNSMLEQHGVVLEESEAREIAAQTTKLLFGFIDVRRLTPGQRIVVARELRKKYRMSYTQIARRIHLPEAEVRKYV